MNTATKTDQQQPDRHEDDRAPVLTLDGLAFLAGPRGAVLYSPDGNHDVTYDRASLRASGGFL